MLLWPVSTSTWLCCFLAIVAHAQTPAAPPQSSGAISGVVVDAHTNTPIRRAIITLSTVETRPQDAVAWTDANGRFSFGYLPPGRYQLRAAKDTYQMTVYGSKTPSRPAAIIQLANGEARSDFIFRLQLMSSISGIVLDDDGDPLAGVQVMTMTPGFQRQKRRLLPGPGTMTDSNGRYRLSGLAPGRYALVVNSTHRQGLKMRPEVSTGQPQQQYYSYGVQYYPGSDRSDSAALIAVQPGQEISRIDFQLTARPMASLEGKVVVPAGATSVSEVSVTGMNEDLANRANFGAGASPPDFNFRVDQIPPGSYLLVAQASVDGRRCRGFQRIDVGDLGLRDLAIQVEPSIDLSGSVSVEGPDAAKYSAAFVGLVPGDGLPWNGQPIRANVNKDGSFKITGVPPGVWDINVGPIPPTGYLKSMLLGDDDVLTADMVLRSSTTEHLNIVLSTRAATLEGDVLQGDQPARAVVVLAPDEKLRHVVSFYRVALADDKGHFEIKGATPGRYQLYAFEEFDQRSIQDPDFLKPFESNGVSVTLREGQNTSQKVSMIPGARQ
jgi:hypothetical protein